MRLKVTAAGIATLIALAGCASPPPGPTVGVMPAPNKPFNEFANDQAICKQWASSEVAGQAQAANSQALGGAAVTTLLGAGLGAAIGAASGSPGIGAAIGAASGATVGGAMAANGSAYANMPIQQRYDVAYSQCMYARGNQVPTGYQQPPPGYGPPWVVQPPIAFPALGPCRARRGPPCGRSAGHTSRPGPRGTPDRGAAPPDRWRAPR